MNRVFEHRSWIRDNLIVLIGACLCVYFSYHAIQGNRSFLRLMALDHSIAALSPQHTQITAEHDVLEAKVKAMRPGGLSKDLLEERARAILGYAGRDEMTLLNN